MRKRSIGSLWNVARAVSRCRSERSCRCRSGTALAEKKRESWIFGDEVRMYQEESYVVVLLSVLRAKVRVDVFLVHHLLADGAWDVLRIEKDHK